MHISLISKSLSCLLCVFFASLEAALFSPNLCCGFCVCAYFAYRLTRQTVLQILQTVVLTSRRVSRVFHKYTIFWKLMSLIFGPIQAEVRKHFAEMQLLAPELDLLSRTLQGHQKFPPEYQKTKPNGIGFHSFSTMIFSYK